MNTWQWLLIAILLLSQGLFLFVDAKRRDGHAWLWGIAGLIQFPWPLIIYYYFVWRASRKKKEQ